MPYRRIVIDLDAIKKEAMEEARKIVRELIEEIGAEAFETPERGKNTDETRRMRDASGVSQWNNSNASAMRRCW